MDVSRLQYPADHERFNPARRAAQQVEAREVQRQEQEIRRARADIDSVASKLDDVSSIFNRKLKFSVDREFGGVVVKVIDTTTDKVIKELPPEALQRLHVRIQETLGLLFDETI
ncbi:MAG: flagellar biosynthesis protein FlaG [Spirochaetes bacterium]|jgi:flagellar protein FlaG|nr:flagellar biosynthesis protein FlaG [Spirochaetota bacterium]